MNILVAGAGGAIGGHLVRALLDDGHDVKAADIKPLHQWWQVHTDAHNLYEYDLSKTEFAMRAVYRCEQVYDLAERMGGIGYITNNVVDCADSLRIGMHLLTAAAKSGVEKFFFASSACVYPMHLQQTTNDVLQLREDMAWPAQPEDGYGLSKLYMEELCKYYMVEGRLDTRVARYHNVYGPPGSWNDGREKSPAALCRKVAEAVVSHNAQIEVWGNGLQVRSYLHVSDCVAGTLAVMNSKCPEPMNIGSDSALTIDELITIIERAAHAHVDRIYDLTGPCGVDGRNADITKARAELNWEPVVELEDGIEELYEWIFTRVASRADSGRWATRNGSLRSLPH